MKCLKYNLKFCNKNPITPVFLSLSPPICGIEIDFLSIFTVSLILLEAYRRWNGRHDINKKATFYNCDLLNKKNLIGDKKMLSIPTIESSSNRHQIKMQVWECIKSALTSLQITWTIVARDIHALIFSTLPLYLILTLWVQI